MNLKHKLVLSASLGLLVLLAALSTVAIVGVKRKGDQDLATFKYNKLQHAKAGLAMVVDMAHSYLAQQYAEAGANMDTTAVLRSLGAFRYATGQGHIRVTNSALPFPTMLMDAKSPKLNNTVLASKGLGVSHDNRVVYSALVDVALQTGAGYVAYGFEATQTQRAIYGDSLSNQLAYARAFPPLGWVVSSSMTTDKIYWAINRMAEETSYYLRNVVYIALGLSLVLLALGVGLAYRFADWLYAWVLGIKERLQEMGKGKKTKPLAMKSNNEIGQLGEALNHLIWGYQTYAVFASEVGNGNLDFEFKPLSDEDITGNELLNMRDNLKKNQKDNQERNWVSEGQAKFSDLLRRHDKDMEGLCEAMVTEYVSFLGASVGTLFLMEGTKSQQNLVLKATYAYDRIKHKTLQVAVGTGLVGQCALERQAIYLENVPDDYIMIKSGLGEAPPKSVLITPLILDKQVYGAIEIASFGAMPPYQIEFAKQVCNDFASVVASAKTTQQTKALLEESQMMSEQMKAQEEEMRQNVEEMMTTQEEMQRKQKEMEKIIEEKDTEISVLKTTHG